MEHCGPMRSFETEKWRPKYIDSARIPPESLDHHAAKQSWQSRNDHASENQLDIALRESFREWLRRHSISGTIRLSPQAVVAID